MRYTLLCVSIVGLLLAAGSAYPAEPHARTEFDLPAQPLADSLRAVGRRTSTNVLFDPPLVEDRDAPALKASLTADEAFARLLAGTGLRHRFLDEKTVTVAAATIEAASTDTASAASRRKEDELRPLELVQAAGPGAQSNPQDRSLKNDTEGLASGVESAARVELEEIIVTGTHVKGVKDLFAPVTVISRDNMDLAGHTNAADALALVPQNFGGGVTPDTTSANSAEGAGASSVNLRGLGNEATLILLNGRRLAPSGETGNVVDISAIPLSAIDRIEVLADGASAIYGADAIGGVVNIVLRDDFEGAETRLGLNTLTDGGGETVQVGQTLGVSGERARGLVTYEFTSQEELNANDRDFLASRADPTFILPSSEKHSVFASGGAEISERVEISVDAYYNDRETESYNSFSGNQDFQHQDIEQSGVASGLNVHLFGDWEGDLSAAYARSHFRSDYTRLVPTNGGGVDTDSRTEIASLDLSAGGSLFQVTDDAVRGAIGIHYRHEEADLHSISLPTGAARVDTDKSREVFAAFAELYAPLISEVDGVPLIDRLALTAAARYDEYSDVGSSLDPKFGVAWSPFRGVTLRGTYGTSFRAARLEQLRDSIPVARLGIFVDPQSPTGESPALLVLGTKSDIDPEEAETWTAGFDWQPSFLDSARLRATFFSVDYDRRLGAPSAQFDGLGRWAVFTGLPVRDVGQAEVLDLLARADFVQDLSAFFPYLAGLTPEDVTVLLDSRQQNLRRSTVEGVDVDIAYHLQSRVGAWTLSLTSTVLTTTTQQVTPTTPVVDLLDTFANPVDFRLRGHLMWRSALMTAALCVSYIDDYTDDEVPGGLVPIDSWTTVDASLRLDLGKLFRSGAAQDSFLTLSITNLFDEDPPEIVATTARTALGTIYDSSNADPAGRRVGLLLTKKW